MTQHSTLYFDAVRFYAWPHPGFRRDVILGQPMIDLFELYPRRRDGLERPTFWTAVALSVLLHVLLLGKLLPQVHVPSADDLASRETSRSLVVNLAPPTSPPPAPPSPPAARPAPVPARPSPPPTVASRPRPAPPPPVIALNKPAPDAPSPPKAVAPATPAPPAPAGDLSSYIEAQRRARAETPSPNLFSPSSGRPSSPPADDAAARGDRAIAANLGLNRAPTFGPDATKSGGGIFQVQRLGYSDAEFLFYGWNKDIRRNTTQLIEVRKGDASDIRLAVVRKMISIIREHETEDFLWESPRLGRNIILSARLRDNAGLEEFMMREFFSTPR
jgi:hypothetical protein